VCRNVVARHTPRVIAQRFSFFAHHSKHRPRAITKVRIGTVLLPLLLSDGIDDTQVLQAASQLAQTSDKPDPGHLANFLNSTELIGSCDDINKLMKVLKTRRTSLQQEERAVQLQLLQLFLQNAKCAS
jgi:hypothetical protein